MSNKTVYITRREQFNAAHKLWNPTWSDEKNHDVFGKCANENWHGHNYTLWVTVKGTPNTDTGYIADLKELSDLIKKHAVNKLDHRNINLDVPFMKGKMASTENLVVAIWDQIKVPVESLGCTLHSIKLNETDNNSAEYFGE